MKLFQSKQDRRRDEFATLVGDFAREHPKYKDSFLVFCDPDTNVVVGAYQGMISAFQNKSRERTVRDLFKYDANDDQAHGNQSKRNQAIYQFLFEVDGMVDSFAKKVYNIKQGKRDLAYLEKKGVVRIGSEKVDEKGNTKEIAMVGGRVR